MISVFKRCCCVLLFFYYLYVLLAKLFLFAIVENIIRMAIYFGLLMIMWTFFEHMVIVDVKIFKKLNKIFTQAF